CIKAYDTYEFHTVYHAMYNFCTVDLSAFYLDIIKDRLYTFPAKDPARRDAQTVMYLMLDLITRLMAPILPFTTEEVWKEMPDFDRELHDGIADEKNRGSKKLESVHLALRPVADPEWRDDSLAAKWEKIIAVRSEVTKALEEARVAKKIGHSLDASIGIYVDDSDVKQILASFGKDLRDVFIVSDASLLSEPAANGFEGKELTGDLTGKDIKALQITVKKAHGDKCDRCWKYDATTGSREDHPGTCSRCSGALDIINSYRL
ncbi:MAG: class I tRNA ligase family protein, partial [Desulfamplus sp.]|nr:class I tRNA ligase family protein [Desulfamplus sp.]